MLADVGRARALRRGHISWPSLFRLLLDPTISVLLLAALTILDGKQFGELHIVLSLIVFALMIPAPSELERGLSDPSFSWVLIPAGLVLLAWPTPLVGPFDRKILGAWAISVPIAQFAIHRLLALLAPRVLTIEARRKVVIAGASSVGQKLAQRFAANTARSFHFAGFFDDRGSERLGELGERSVLGRLAELPSYVNRAGADAIYIALPMASQPRILRLLDELRDTTASIYFVPDIFVYDLIQARIDDVDGVPVVALCESPFYGVNGLVKRLEDLALASLALVAALPLMVAVAIGVKLTSPGPAIFRQRRCGLDGSQFTVYKFRTMRVMEDGEDVPQAAREDARVTPFGAFLRRTSLDELPQLINVLQGRMSMVGPRPHALAHNERYRKLVKGYMVRHKVRPGITGLAQVRGYRGATETVDKMRKRVEVDLEYLRRWSIWLDLKILFQTVWIVLAGDKNAF
jgi:putative colanic acid biosynthesis UDP-glucose lipid carrier transferase